MNTSTIAAEIANIMHRDLDIVKKELEREVLDPGIHLREACVQTGRTFQDEIENLYKATPAYIYDLMVEEASPVHAQWRESVLATLSTQLFRRTPLRLLGYGAGAGTDCLYFSRRGFSVTHFDLPGIASDFARERFIRHAQPIDVVHDLSPCRNYFDTVVSLKGLERFRDPLRHLDTMIRTLKKTGLLFLTEAFPFSSNQSSSHLSSTQYADELPRLLKDSGCELQNLLQDGLCVFKKVTPITVIVPICNAYQHLTRLLSSIESTNSGIPCNWLFVNDGSSDPRISESLSRFANEFARGQVDVIDRKVNLGFVASCNEGMSRVAGMDVVLLNSDTVLYDGWLAKLARAAYSDNAIGTVTALSNDASCFTICPKISMANQINSVLEELRLDPLDVPSGVGFCLYIKGEVLDRVGLFDPVFGRGYGEETDLCQRASAAGYRNVIDRTSFIYHFGRGSMAAAGVIERSAKELPEHETIIERRYPSYTASVQSFIAGGVMGQLSALVSYSYLQRVSSQRPSVALIVHSNIDSGATTGATIGGTEFHVRDLIENLRDSFVLYVLSPQEKEIKVTGHADGVVAEVAWRAQSYRDLFTALRPSLIHIHHTKHFLPFFVEELIRWDGPKVLTVHDYFSVCPQYTLLDYRGRYCGVPQASDCDACASRLFGTGFPAVHKHRSTHQRLIDSVARVVVPSDTTASVLTRAFDIPNEKFCVIPHPYPESATVTWPQLETTSVVNGIPPKVGGDDHTLVVGFLGYSTPHKGEGLVRGILAALREDDGVRVVMIGANAGRFDGVISTGQYQREQVVGILRNHGVDVVVLTSPWPETFSYVLSEAWLAGVPAIAGPLGAPAERIRRYGGGIVVGEYRTQAFVDTIRRLAGNQSLLMELKRNVGMIPKDADFARYRRLYNSLIATLPQQTSLFAGVVMTGASEQTEKYTPPPIVRTLWRLRARLFPLGTTREKWYLNIRRRLMVY